MLLTYCRPSISALQVNEKSLNWIRESHVAFGEEVIGILIDFAIFWGFDDNEAVTCDDEEVTLCEPTEEDPLFSLSGPRMGEASAERPVLR